MTRSNKYIFLKFGVSHLVSAPGSAEPEQAPCRPRAWVLQEARLQHSHFFQSSFKSVHCSSLYHIVRFVV